MIWRVRRRQTFVELRRRGTRVRSGAVRMTFVAVDSIEPQVAFAFSRRFGTAVERNRARRRLREAFRRAWSEADPIGAYQLTGSRRVLTDEFSELVTAVRRALDQLAPTDAAVVPAGSDSR